MGDVVEFPSWRSHWRALRTVAPRRAWIDASTSSVSSSRPNVLARLTIACQCSAGIEARERQLLTVDRPIPNSEAAAAVPPIAPITSSTTRIMTDTLVRSLRTSQGFAKCGQHFVVGRDQLSGMAKGLKDIANRLVATRLALGFETQKEFCDEIGAGKNTYNAFEKAKRRISIDVAMKIRDRFGISLDWIYAGDPAQLPAAIYRRIERAA